MFFIHARLDELRVHRDLARSAREIERHRDDALPLVGAGDLVGHLHKRPADYLRHAARATELGFKAESSFEEIIRIHIEDELGGRIAG